MRSALRQVLAWTVTLSLVAGSWLPLVSQSGVFDADGICGGSLALDDSGAYLDAANTSPVDGHCAFCHWRHTMASASTAALAEIRVPLDATRFLSGRPTHSPDGPVSGVAAPRGPPAIS